MSLLFHECLEPQQRAVPLSGNEIEILLHPLYGPRIEMKLAFAAGPGTPHQANLLQHAQVLGDCLP